MEAQAEAPVVYKKGDPDMPKEFRDMLVKLLLDEHLENNGNTEYRKILANIALREWPQVWVVLKGRKKRPTEIGRAHV